MDTSRRHQPAPGNIAYGLVLVSGIFFLLCAVVYNEWTAAFAARVVRAHVSPGAKIPLAADVRAMQLAYVVLAVIFLTAAFAFQRSKQLQRAAGRPVFAKITLAVIALLLPAATLEIALRPYAVSVSKNTSLFVPDDELGWRMRPNVTEIYDRVSITTNARGFRFTHPRLLLHPRAERQYTTYPPPPTAPTTTEPSGSQATARGSQ